MPSDLSKLQIRELRFWALPRDQQFKVSYGGVPRTMESLINRGLLVHTSDGLLPSTEGWRLLLTLAEAGNPPWQD